MARSGGRWRDLPERFGKHEAVKRRYWRRIERACHLCRIVNRRTDYWRARYIRANSGRGGRRLDRPGIYGLKLQTKPLKRRVSQLRQRGGIRSSVGGTTAKTRRTEEDRGRSPHAINPQAPSKRLLGAHRGIAIGAIGLKAQQQSRVKCTAARCIAVAGPSNSPRALSQLAVRVAPFILVGLARAILFNHVSVAVSTAQRVRQGRLWLQQCRARRRRRLCRTSPIL